MKNFDKPTASNLQSVPTAKQKPALIAVPQHPSKGVHAKSIGFAAFNQTNAGGSPSSGTSLEHNKKVLVKK